MPKQDNIYKRKILTYDDVMLAAAGDSDEPLVDVRTYDSSITSLYYKHDMDKYTGDIIFVRDTVARKLASVNAALHNEHGLHLKVVYGYRNPEVQDNYFKARRAALSAEYPNLDNYEIDRLTHNFVAVPDAAGHPTGGAVDLTVVDSTGSELDMGNRIADYTDPEIIKTYARVSLEQEKNRGLLHNLMISQGFAPFYGEWWHFSYGDREWAAFYNEKALYGAINFRIK